MQIDLSDQTICDVEAMLARQGAAIDVPTFVNRTLQRALYFETVREVKRKNADIDPDRLQNEIDEAVAEVRASRRKAAGGADRS